MSDLRKAAEMALEALETDQKQLHWKIVRALRKALAQEQKPVCFIRETAWSYEIAPWDDQKGFPVYAAPPKREWVGLTDEDKNEIYKVSKENNHTWGMFMRDIEAKLKEKNT